MDDFASNMILCREISNIYFYKVTLQEFTPWLGLRPRDARHFSYMILCREISNIYISTKRHSKNSLHGLAKYFVEIHSRSSKGTLGSLIKKCYKKSSVEDFFNSVPHFFFQNTKKTNRSQQKCTKKSFRRHRHRRHSPRQIHWPPSSAITVARWVIHSINVRSPSPVLV